MEKDQDSDKILSVRFVAACVITFFHVTAAFISIPVLPVLAVQFGASVFLVGAIRSGYFLLAAILSIPMGRLSDIIGRKLLIQVGMALSVISSMAIFFSNSVIELLIFFSIGGLGAAAFAPTMDSYIGDILPKKKMVRGYSWYQTSMQLGMVVGPGLGGFIAAAYTLQTSFLVAAAIAMTSSLLALFFIKKTKSGGSIMTFSFRQLLRTRPTIIVLAAWILILGMAFVRAPFDFLFALYGNGIGLDIVTIGLLFTLPASIGLLARIPIAYLADRMGKKDAFVVFGALLAFLPMIVIYSLTDILSISLLLLLIGFGTATYSTTVMARIAEDVDSSERGFAMGGANMMRFGGFTMGSLIIGASAGSLGFFYGFLPAVIVAGIGVLAYIMLVRKG